MDRLLLPSFPAVEVKGGFGPDRDLEKGEEMYILQVKLG